MLEQSCPSGICAKSEDNGDNSNHSDPNRLASSWPVSSVGKMYVFFLETEHLMTLGKEG